MTFVNNFDDSRAVGQRRKLSNEGLVLEERVASALRLAPDHVSSMSRTMSWQTWKRILSIRGS
jgi:hypothetical protein